MLNWVEYYFQIRENIMDTNVVHIVAKGDTLSTLAKKYNTTVTELKKPIT